MNKTQHARSSSTLELFPLDVKKSLSCYQIFRLSSVIRGILAVRNRNHPPAELIVSYSLANGPFMPIPSAKATEFWFWTSLRHKLLPAHGSVQHPVAGAGARGRKARWLPNLQGPVCNCEIDLGRDSMCVKTQTVMSPYLVRVVIPAMSCIPQPGGLEKMTKKHILHALEKKQDKRCLWQVLACHSICPIFGDFNNLPVWELKNLKQ